MVTNESSAQIAGARNWLRKLEKVIGMISRWLNWIAGAGLISMLSLVVFDIIGIKLFSQPIPGGIEIVAFLGVVVIGFAIAWTQVLKGHIQVDFIVMKISDRPRAVIDAVMTLFGIAFFVILGWQTWVYAQSIQSSGEVSMTQQIPFFPFIYGLAVCYFVTILVLVVDFLKTILKAGKTWNL